MAYATDSDLTARIPATSSAPIAARTLALADAAAEIDDRSYGDRTVRAHCYLAAHILQINGSIVGGEAGTPTSLKAGQIQASFAAPAISGPATLALTKWGRAFLAIRSTVLHYPESA